MVGGHAAIVGIAQRDKRDQARVGFQAPDHRNGPGITCGIDQEIVDPSGLA